MRLILHHTKKRWPYLELFPPRSTSIIICLASMYKASQLCYNNNNANFIQFTGSFPLSRPVSIRSYHTSFENSVDNMQKDITHTHTHTQLLHYYVTECWPLILKDGSMTSHQPQCHSHTVHDWNHEHATKAIKLRDPKAQNVVFTG